MDREGTHFDGALPHIFVTMGASVRINCLNNLQQLHVFPNISG